MPMKNLLPAYDAKNDIIRGKNGVEEDSDENSEQ